jgi:hypothetical protein
MDIKRIPLRSYASRRGKRRTDPDAIDSGKIVGYALVSDEDFEWLSQWRWSLSSDGYVRRRTAGGGQVYMHRAVGERMAGRRLTTSDQVHHRHEQKLDNRREELVIRDPLTHKAEHHTNPGVRFCKRHHKWYARPTINGKKVWLGYQPDEATAVAVVERARAAA